MKTALMRRLQTLEAMRASSARDEQAASRRAVLELALAHPEVDDLLDLLEQIALLVEQGDQDGPEVRGLMKRFEDRVNSTGAQEGPERTHR